MKRIWIAALLAVLALAACTPGDKITPAPLVTGAADATTPLPPGTMPATGGAAVIVQRSGGIAGTSDQWAIFPDGRVLVGRTNEFRVLPAAVTGLMASIERRGFFALEMGQLVIAEGIEKEHTMSVLQALGVQYGQGHLIGRPGDLPTG